MPLVIFSRRPRVSVVRTTTALDAAAPDVEQRLGIPYHPGERAVVLDVPHPAWCNRARNDDRVGPRRGLALRGRHQLNDAHNCLLTHAAELEITPARHERQLRSPGSPAVDAGLYAPGDTIS